MTRAQTVSSSRHPGLPWTSLDGQKPEPATALNFSSQRNDKRLSWISKEGYCYLPSQWLTIIPSVEMLGKDRCAHLYHNSNNKRQVNIDPPFFSRSAIKPWHTGSIRWMVFWISIDRYLIEAMPSGSRTPPLYTDRDRYGKEGENHIWQLITAPCTTGIFQHLPKQQTFCEGDKRNSTSRCGWYSSQQQYTMWPTFRMAE